MIWREGLFPADDNIFRHDRIETKNSHSLPRLVFFVVRYHDSTGMQRTKYYFSPRSMVSSKYASETHVNVEHHHVRHIVIMCSPLLFDVIARLAQSDRASDFYDCTSPCKAVI